MSWLRNKLTIFVLCKYSCVYIFAIAELFYFVLLLRTSVISAQATGTAFGLSIVFNNFGFVNIVPLPYEDK